MSASRSAIRIVTSALVVGALFGSSFQAAQATRWSAATVSPAVKSNNLIKNPGGETGTGSSNGSVVNVPIWGSIGDATAVKYGASGGFPKANTPGPPNRGKNFLAGGPTSEFSNLVQSFSIAAYKDAINAGHVSFTLKGWLGGFAADRDHTNVRIGFRDVDANDLGSFSLATVTNTQRNNQTKFLLRSKSGPVPRRAKFVDVVITFTRVNGAYNDGYVDNLSLIFSGI